MCVFSSRNVFTNVFTREEGISPREWYKKQNPA
jgi:AraC-like DNA-binding protein